jgi:hypothetical protein
MNEAFINRFISVEALAKEYNLLQDDRVREQELTRCVLCNYDVAPPWKVFRGNWFYCLKCKHDITPIDLISWHGKIPKEEVVAWVNKWANKDETL